MTYNPEFSDHQPVSAEHALTEQFIQAQQQHPEHVLEVSEQEMWDKLSADQRDLVTVAAANLFPDDLEARQNAIRVHLAVEHVRLEGELVNTMEAQFSTPAARHPLDNDI